MGASINNVIRKWEGESPNFYLKKKKKHLTLLMNPVLNLKTENLIPRMKIHRVIIIYFFFYRFESSKLNHVCLITVFKIENRNIGN